VKNAMERYEDIDPSFAGSREHKLLGDLSSAAEEGDADAFTGALAEYDSMSRLDPWKTKMLLRAKKQMTKAIEEEEDDLT
jgi:alpha-soluble NSF attachment protein